MSGHLTPPVEMPPWLGQVLEFQAKSSNSVLHAALEKQMAEQQAALEKQMAEQQVALAAQQKLYDEQLGRLEKRLMIYCLQARAAK